MTRTERKEFLRRFKGRMPSIFGGGGCQCGTCKRTNGLRLAGFDKWPRGETLTPGEVRKAYSAHVSFSFKGAKKSEGVGPSGAGFYGTPAGMSRADVERVLQETFRESVQ